jgi:hypothetical protein
LQKQLLEPYIQCAGNEQAKNADPNRSARRSPKIRFIETASRGFSSANLCKERCRTTHWFFRAAFAPHQIRLRLKQLIINGALIAALRIFCDWGAFPELHQRLTSRNAAP